MTEMERITKVIDNDFKELTKEVHKMNSDRSPYSILIDRIAELIIENAELKQKLKKYEEVGVPNDISKSEE